MENIIPKECVETITEYESEGIKVREILRSIVETVRFLPIVSGGWTKYFQPKIAVVVPNRNRPWDFLATNRLLMSLRASDFPEQYLLYSPVGGTSHESRKDGVEQALHSGVEYILVSDNDCIAPKLWWSKYLEKFESDNNLGCITISSEDWKHPKPEFRVPIRTGDHFEHLWDGFVVFRRQFLLDSEIRDGAFNWAHWKLRPWRVLITRPVEHNKRVLEETVPAT